MTRAKRKKTAGTRGPKKTKASPPLDPLRAGMPALDSITGIEEFRKGKKVLRIIHTNEIDEYEQQPSKARRPTRRSKDH
jgi:hypothetical protein